VAWPTAASSAAFLVMDRNGNGTIDSGAELFGRPVVGGGRKPNVVDNGFARLAELDRRENGGNGDGALTPVDRQFAQLRLWTDANHDGVTQPEELQPLSAVGIQSIGLTYQAVGKRDRNGNLLRYRGAVTLASGKRLEIWDVFLKVKAQ
jgi:hypothetical protein